MKGAFLIFLGLLTLPSVNAQHLFTTPITASDVTHFWEAFDEFEKDTTKNPFERYIKIGTPGLTDLSYTMIGGSQKLRKHVMKRMEFYRQARQVSETWREYTDKINYVAQQMTARIPGIKFPSVYLVIGKENCGGTLSGNGIIIGLETFCYSPGTDPFNMNRSMENLPETIATVVAWHNLLGQSENTLIEYALAAGSAEFFVKQVVRDLRVKHPEWAATDAYGEAHACELWAKFAEDRNKTELKEWFWNYNQETPANLGNWVGYKITSEYYLAHKDDPEVMRACLNVALLKDYVERVMLNSFCR